ncbi:MAG: hypothetical protein MJ183_01540, partial [Treponemataceae bacterium]|nr:hypothetical protein [Treponemataceae bacterium]
INPFYWNGIKDNSIYDSSSSSVVKFSDLKGHIELEGDLPETFNLTSGLMDKDPKVSGKVVITGTASDNNLLNELYISLDGMNNQLSGLNTKTVGGITYYRVATYNRESQEWTSHLDALDEKGLVFAVDSQSFADGHLVNWSLTWDTEKVQGVAKLDAALEVLATDLGTPTLSGETVTYESNESSAAYYRMDVVPYVVKVYTTLAKQKANNWSVYNRTAQGHYPVQSVIQKASTAETANGTIQRTTKSEDVTLHGFNLNGTVAITGATNPSVNGPAENALAHITFNVANLASGELEATVNGIALMNNLNNNDAKGSATVDGTANVNKYNMQGNGDTNNILTDDLVFDVWEFNDRAAVPINGMATGVQMQVNQVSHMLNFAFANGGLFYSMGGKVNNVDYSSIYWAADWDTFAGPCTGLVVDSLGYTYSVDSGGDTNNSGSVDKYNLYTSRWGLGSRNTDGTLSGTRSRRLEEIAIKTGDGTYDYSLMKYRYLSSELATSVSGKTTNLYLVNYDALTDEIRFRAGAFNNTTVGDKGGFVDEYKNGNSSYYSTNNCQVIANSRNGGSFPKDKDGGTTDVDSITGRGAGQYVDIAIATNGPNSKDVACVVWFDAYDNCLKYTYYVDPIANWTNLKSDNTAKGWSDPTTIFAEGGEYCQIAVDANNHIHIAAYAGNGDVKYAYLESYNSSYSESDNSCTVDASGSVGEHLTLDVALDDNGNSIPYIGYFTSAIKAPKYAYLVDTTHENKVPAGVDANESFTGAWEVTVVPTPSRLTTNREDKVNIGVFKTTDGVLNWSTTDGSQPAANGSNIGTNECSSSAKGYADSTETSKAYGNGSKNAVFAYQISGGTGSCVETAQMR